jgi:hypothetical protein
MIRLAILEKEWNSGSALARVYVGYFFFQKQEVRKKMHLQILSPIIWKPPNISDGTGR